jgi:predicted dehydrogenase
LELVPRKATEPGEGNSPVVGFIGAGNYASKILIPAFQKTKGDLECVVSSGGVSAASAARRFGFRCAGTDADVIFSDDQIDLVAIATKHDSHAALVIEALRREKAVFVEKPLALTLSELERIETEYRRVSQSGRPWLLVGFNRRFSPLARKMKALLRDVDAPKNMIMTINAGRAAAGDWTLDPTLGGGRILGEACHFIDLLRFMAGAPAEGVTVATPSSRTRNSDGSLTFSINYGEGSVGTIHYLTDGNRAFPKERLEVFCAGRILQLDNFRTLRGWGFSGFKAKKLWRQDKGATQMVAEAVDSIRTGQSSPIAFEELIEVSRFAIEVANA